MVNFPTIGTIIRARRLLKSINLDLCDLTVYTEAATGGYCVTAGLAAMSGAERVFALAKDSRHCSAQNAAEATLHFARLANVENRIEIVFEKRAADLALADILTNSGHVRPIDEATVSALKRTAVIPLMYEAWEFRPQDINLTACRRQGISVAGIDEAHPLVGILCYLGMMAIKLLLDGGVEVVGTRIALWSDNKFYAYIVPILANAGAEVLLFSPPNLFSGMDHMPRVYYLGDLEKIVDDLSLVQNVDAVLLVMSPESPVCIGEPGKALVSSADLASIAPGAIIAQFWGQVDRGSVVAAGLRSLPASPPPLGHMGVLPSDLGLVPVLRLQSGGLKVGEIMARARMAGATPQETEELVVKTGFGQTLMVSGRTDYYEHS